MKVSYKLFPDYFATTPMTIELGDYKKQKKAVYYKLGSFETIQCDKYNLVVDHNQKSINVLEVINNDVDFNNNLQDDLIKNMENTLKYCSKIEFKEISKTSAEYIFNIAEASEYSMIKLVFNRKSYFIESLELFYANEQDIDYNKEGTKVKPRMLISYSDIKTNPVFDENTFSYLRFLKKKDGRLVCKEEYIGYTLFTQL